MADKEKGSGKGAPGESASADPAAAEAASPQINVLAQYVKDLSFESPGAPRTLQTPGENPQLSVNVNVNAAGRGDEIYEVALNLEVHAKSDAGVIYNIEMVYGGLFRLHSLPEQAVQPVLFVDCPAILFPFMRRVLGDLTRDGGFPPLMLDPIDFRRLYSQNLQRAQAQAKTQEAKN